MHKFILAAMVLAISATPSLADRTKLQGKTKYQHPQAETTFEGSSSYERAKKRVQQEDYVDPYWTPCDYTTNWGPNACGGGG
jgi:hypothetical protein